MAETIADLLTEGLTDEPTFLERHPAPALVFDPSPDAEGTAVDTPSGGEPSARDTSTEVMGALQAAQQLSRISEVVDRAARVAWLEKSERNPFGSLITLGRAKNNDVVVKHATVSKLHAIFTAPEAGSWVVEDDDSSNGTFVNGVKLAPKQKTPLNDGDSLRFGPDVQARFFMSASLRQFLEVLR